MHNVILKVLLLLYKSIVIFDKLNESDDILMYRALLTSHEKLVTRMMLYREKLTAKLGLPLCFFFFFLPFDLSDSLLLLQNKKKEGFTKN